MSHRQERCGAISRWGDRSASPADAAFQHRVLAHAFGLLDATGPVFEEFEETIADEGTEVLACNLSPRHDPDLHPAIDEARGLRPAYDRAVKQYGKRMGAGRVVDADDIPDAIDAFIRIAKGTPWKEAGIPGIPARVSQDIRGYYETAAMGLSDHVPAAVGGHTLVLRQDSGRRHHPRSVVVR